MTASALEDYTYTVGKNDMYYFIWENYGNTKTVNFTLDYTLTEYDVSDPVYMTSGTFNLQSPQYEYMIIKNMHASVYSSIEFSIVNEPILSFNSPLVIIGLISIIVVVVFIGIGAKKSAARQKSATQTQNPLGIQQDSEFSTSGGIPISCHSCGQILEPSAIKELNRDGDVFCQKCGTCITK